MKNRKGFTIVELVIVIAVIAILAAVLIPTFSGVINKANESSALQTARSTLTNVLNMSSTAQLAGKTDTCWKTIFVVDGYAYGYTGNQLEGINYPGYKGEHQLKKGATSTNNNEFNSIIIAAENLIEGDPTYTALAAEPDDWATKYTNYYSKSGDVYTKLSGDSAPAFAADTYYSAEVTSYAIAASIWNVINVNGDGTTDAKGVSELTTNSVSKKDGHYYLNYNNGEWDAEIFINSDLSNKVVVFTTFGK